MELHVAVLEQILFSLASNKDQLMKILDEQLREIDYYYIDLGRAKTMASSPSSELD